MIDRESLRVSALAGVNKAQADEIVELNDRNAALVAEVRRLREALGCIYQNCDATTAPFHLRVKYIAEIARGALDGDVSELPATAADAADLIEQKIKDYHDEHGMYDPSTGVTEYPGTGEEWVHEMEELAEEIRALRRAREALAKTEGV